MNETERVREEIATLLRHFVIEYEKAWRGEPCKTPKNIAAQILKIKGLVVEADDQTLPIENSDVEAMYAGIFNASYPSIAGANDVLATERIASAMKVYKKRLLKAGWRKVA